MEQAKAPVSVCQRGHGVTGGAVGCGPGQGLPEPAVGMRNAGHGMVESVPRGSPHRSAARPRRRYLWMSADLECWETELPGKAVPLPVEAGVSISVALSLMLLPKMSRYLPLHPKGIPSRVPSVQPLLCSVVCPGSVTGQGSSW